MPCRPDSLLLLAQDVPDGQGFVCIPGSHKRNFMPPDNTGLQSLSGEGIPQISLYDGPPTVANLCPRAGSCIVFTEALRHGIRRWHAEYPRLTVFNRCALDAHPGDSLSPHAVLTPDERLWVHFRQGQLACPLLGWARCRGGRVDRRRLAAQFAGSVCQPNLGRNAAAAGPLCSPKVVNRAKQG
jgi:hypothetical protein